MLTHNFSNNTLHNLYDIYIMLFSQRKLRGLMSLTVDKMCCSLSTNWLGGIVIVRIIYPRIINKTILLCILQ